jgi:hypothetical protein
MLNFYSKSIGELTNTLLLLTSLGHFYEDFEVQKSVV